MSIKKINLSDEGNVRSRVASGIKKMSDLVGLTLGPAGRSILIERGVGEPLIVDDGRRVAENIKLDDPIEQLAVRVAYGVTRKTDEKVGDGTTTSMVLTNAILSEISKNHIAFGVGATVDVSDIDNQIQKGKKEVLDLLDKKAKQIKTEAELKEVASIVAGDKKLGDIIGGMYWQLGKDGHISMEFNLLTEEIETEVVKGYRFSGGYAAPWMITNPISKECILNDVDVIITKQKVTDFGELVNAANLIGSTGKHHMVIVAPKFSESVLKMIYQNATRKQQPFVIIAVRAPGRGEEALKDMAIFTGGKFFNEGDDLKEIRKEDFGYISRIELTDDTCILIEGKGNETDIKKRIKEVEAEAKLQKLPQFKADRYERASALSGGVGVIRIGAPTDEERNWLKYKIEDAVKATKQAYRSGIVAGGGMTLKKISEDLPEGHVLKEALNAPYETLKKNCGGKLTVGKNVIDPVAVEKAALEHACSAVSKLIRIGGAIAHTEPSLVDELGSMLRNAPGNDLLDAENEE